ncbi:FAST kinase domain-containing protein 5, mitochondrial, partial [Teleopsis dalmanni]|uniref:FAST kinase domain-containing protein 5, mitochondrial n=1 Tax=Teleopsis dalmanni TaxID=139649 RepID=UPI0018CEDA3C
KRFLNSYNIKVLKFNKLSLLNYFAQVSTNNFAARCYRTAAVKNTGYFGCENEHAHNVLKESLKPYQIFRLNVEANSIKSEKDFSDPATLAIDPKAAESDIFEHFCLVTQYCTKNNKHISNECFKDFVQLFCRILPKLTDEQLLEALRRIALLPLENSTSADNFIDLWNHMDIECCRRIERWDVDEILLVCDAWYTLKLARICEFVEESFRKIGRKVRKMKPEQLVHSMFFCNLLRKPLDDKLEFEENLLSCADKLTLQELAVMSLGFFKTKTPIRNPDLLSHIYKRLMSELETIDDISLVALLKIIRYSSKIPFANSLAELLDALTVHIERFSLLSCLHIALLGNDLQFCHNESLERVLKRFNTEISTVRLKDLERIALVIALFDFESKSGVEKEICQKIMDSLQNRVDEIMLHPRCFPLCMHYLSVKGYYDKEMLGTIFDPKFLLHTYKNNAVMARELFQLDAFIKINLKQDNYVGPQLSDKYRRTMGKMLTNYLPERHSKYKLSATDKVLLEVKDTFEDLSLINQFRHVLPHFERTDIVICYDKKLRKAIPISEECPEHYVGAMLTRKDLLGDLDAPHIETLVVTVTGWNNVLRGTTKVTGFFKLKFNQLELLGHRPVIIYWHEWRGLETAVDRKNFLKRKLSTIVKL